MMFSSMTFVGGTNLALVSVFVERFQNVGEEVAHDEAGALENPDLL